MGFNDWRGPTVNKGKQNLRATLSQILAVQGQRHDVFVTPEQIYRVVYGTKEVVPRVVSDLRSAVGENYVEEDAKGFRLSSKGLKMMNIDSSYPAEVPPGGEWNGSRRRRYVDSKKALGSAGNNTEFRGR